MDQMYISRVTSEDAQLYYCVDLETSNQWYEIQLHVKGCPPSTPDVNWTHHELIDKCYGVYQKRALSFGGAQGWCIWRGSRLAMPKTQKQIDALKSLYPEKARVIWIGLTDLAGEGFWRWLDGNVLRKSQENWTPGHPNDWSGGLLEERGQDCAVMSSSGKWSDEMCYQDLPFICEIPDYDWARNRRLEEKRCPTNWLYFECGGFCYSQVTFRANWKRAKKFCSSLKSKLAMPKTASESMYVSNLLHERRLDDDAWIGLSKHQYDHERDLWEWADGTLFHWKMSIINSSTAFHHRCAVMKQHNWLYTSSCDDEKYFICQKPQESLQRLILPTHVCGEQPLPDFVMHGRSTRSSKPNQTRTQRSNLDLDIGRILRGTPISIADFPWMVKIEVDGEFMCSAVLISPRYVLTAAHCVTSLHDIKLENSRLHVVLGTEEQDIRSGRHERVHNVQIHKCFVGNKLNKKNVAHTYQYDVAVVELKKSVQPDCWNTRPACFLDQNDLLLEPKFQGYDCVYAGWGGLKEDSSLDFCWLGANQFAELNAQKNMFRIKRWDPNACSATHGDSGGPLMCRKRNSKVWYLAGLVTGLQDIEIIVTYAKSFLPLVEEVMQRSLSTNPEYPIYANFKVYEERIGYGQLLDITCDFGRPPFISIRSGVFGQLAEWSQCPDNATPRKQGCTFDVTAELMRRCNRRNHCKLQAHKDILGNKCGGSELTLLVKYQCVYEIPFFYYCDHFKNFTLSCGEGNGLTIFVTLARYGKSSREKCPPPPGQHFKYSDTCIDRDVAWMIKKRCKGKAVCHVWLPDVIWSSLCPEGHGFEKYLSLKYECHPDRFDMPDYLFPQLLTGGTEGLAVHQSLWISLSAIWSLQFGWSLGADF